MPDDGNVIEVDFARDSFLRDPVTELVELRDEMTSTYEQVKELERRERWERAMLRDLARSRQRRIRELEAQLRESQPVTEERVLATLIDVYEGQPVRAGTLAEHLYETPLHSTKVRIGHVLSRLADDGKVRRQKHHHCRGCEYDHHSSWAPLGGDDA